MSVLQLNLRPVPATAAAAAAAIGLRGRYENKNKKWNNLGRPGSWIRVGLAVEEKTKRKGRGELKKPDICTADELHYVHVSNSDWKVALWRYLPPPSAPPRKHPLMLLSGLATNAVGYDLSPKASFARFMSGQGYDTWILEVRGAGLSSLGVDGFEEPQYSDTSSSGKSQSKLLQALKSLTEQFSGFFDEGKNPFVANRIRDLSQKLAGVIEARQQSARPQLFDFQEPFFTALEDLLVRLDLTMKYDWDFDHYLEEDVPAAMDYIRNHCNPEDGKLLAVGHSMGGILLYAMLSRCCFEGRDSSLRAVATLGSSLDYSCSASSLKVFLPATNPARALKVPVIPIGPFMASAPPYVLSWLSPQITTSGMMHSELLEKLVLNNFCTVPTKLLLQLSTVFQEGGLRDRSGTFFYKDHLGKSKVPVLAVAGDQDLVCPPQSVYETVKVIPKHLVTYKLFGKPSGPHYAHYDLVAGRLAVDQVYRCLIDFLNRHDL